MKDSIKNDIREKVAEQEVKCTWLNSTICSSTSMNKINNVDIDIEPYKPTKKQKVLVLTSTINGYGELVCDCKIVEKERYKHPAECSTQIANSILLNAKVQIMSARLISETILKASHVLANSIDNLTNEIERKNKLDEYYMLIREIEQFEDTLLQLGTFKEAYEKLELVMLPTIQLDEYEVYILNKLTDEFVKYDEIIQLAKHYLVNPLTIMCEVFKKEEIIIDPTTFCVERLCEIKEEYNEAVERITKVNQYESDYDEYKEKVERCKNEYERLSKISVDDNETTIINKWNKLKLDENVKRKIAFSKYYIKISEDIEIINREILLNNLRRLHSELRNAARRYKIQSYDKE